MLSLSRKTDYALLALTALARHRSGYMSLRALATRYGMPYRTLEQVVRPLVARGILASREGARGGYRLAKNPKDVTMKEIVAAEEGGVALVACLDASKGFACELKPACPAHKRLPRIQQILLNALAEQTLLDVLDERSTAQSV